ncbi:MAG: TatD family hydrolase [Prevotella sp.]|nr:TatD family hydrolase [Prevotella sp.]
MKNIYIDTHAHLDGCEFSEDLSDVILRAREAGVGRIFLPAIDLKSAETIQIVCRQFPNYVRPMLGLHPEEVRADWQEVLREMRRLLRESLSAEPSPCRYIAIGEVGLDFYWSRDFEREQMEAFEEQVRWSVETQLPLMIHCRKAQNEMIRLLKRYEKDLPGGVFHCFTGNEREAAELLQFDRFVLGIGGVLTFKKSHLPEVLPSCVPLSRIVLETDAPYMAPVPHRGGRNESAYVRCVLHKLAECYGVSDEEVARQTTENVVRVFGSAVLDGI